MCASVAAFSPVQSSRNSRLPFSIHIDPSNLPVFLIPLSLSDSTCHTLDAHSLAFSSHRFTLSLLCYSSTLSTTNCARPTRCSKRNDQVCCVLCAIFNVQCALCCVLCVVCYIQCAVCCVLYTMCSLRCLLRVYALHAHVHCNQTDWACSCHEIFKMDIFTISTQLLSLFHSSHQTDARCRSSAARGARSRALGSRGRDACRRGRRARRRRQRRRHACGRMQGDTHHSLNNIATYLPIMMQE